MNPSSSQVDNEELARFREEWKNEVRQKLHQTTPDATSTAATSTATGAAKGQTPEPETTRHKAKRPSTDLSKTLGRLHQRVDAVGPVPSEVDGRRVPPRNVAEISLTHKQIEALGEFTIIQNLTLCNNSVYWGS